MSYKYGPSIVTDGLVFYVDAANSKSYDGSAGGTTWTDLVGGNDGTLTNMDTNPASGGYSYDSGNGGSLVFDGVDDHAVASVASTTASSFTWINTFKSPNISNTFRLVNNRGNSGKGIWIQGESTYARLVLGTIAAYDISFTFSSNQIYNVAVVVSGASYELYVDGVFVGSTTISSTRTDSNSNNYYFSSGLNVDGTVGAWANQEIYFSSYYDKALSASEILQNYNALKNRFV